MINACLLVSKMDLIRFPALLRRIYEIVDELEEMFPGRHFTPDGHMVGSIGEAIAAFHYNISLFTASAKGHDGSVDGRLVQVKATQGGSISISSEPESLLVLRLTRDGDFQEVYNGPGRIVWETVSHKPRPKNGQYQVSLARLAKLMQGVSEIQKVRRVSR